MVTYARNALKRNFVDNAANEALELVSFVSEIPKNELVGKPCSLSPVQKTRLDNLLLRRIKGEPLQYLLGFWEFYGLRFNLNSSVLIPRQDTESVVEEALEILKNIKNPVICDIGTGSGAIAVVIAKNTGAAVTAIDISPEAIETAKQNSLQNKTEINFLVHDMTIGYEGAVQKETLDMIISNPPYIKTSDIAALSPTVYNYEPVTALDGREDGLFFYKIIAAKWKDALKHDGVLIVEIGLNQENDIAKILSGAGFKQIEAKPDLNGIKRMITAKK